MTYFYYYTTQWSALSFKICDMKENLHEFVQRVHLDVDTLDQNLNHARLHFESLAQQLAKKSPSCEEEMRDSRQEDQEEKEEMAHKLFLNLQQQFWDLNQRLNENIKEINEGYFEELEEACQQEKSDKLLEVFPAVIKNLEETHSTFLSGVMDIIGKLDSLDGLLFEIWPQALRIAPFILSQLLMCDDIVEDKLYGCIQDINDIMEYLRDQQALECKDLDYDRHSNSSDNGQLDDEEDSSDKESHKDEDESMFP